MTSHRRFLCLAASVLVIACSLPFGAGSADAVISCGAGKWFDDAAEKPVCFECAEPAWCPEDRAQDSQCRVGHTVPPPLFLFFFFVSKCNQTFIRAPSSSPSTHASTPKPTPGTPHTQGFACSRCELGYFYDSEDLCAECPPLLVSVCTWGGVALFVVLAIFLMYQAAAASLDITTFTIVTTHFQFCYVFLSFPFYYPAAVNNWGNWLGLVSGFVFEILAGRKVPGSPNCLTRSNGDEGYLIWWVASSMTPILLMLPFWAAYRITSGRQEAAWERDNAKAAEDRILSLAEYKARNDMHNMKKRSIKTILMIFVFALVTGMRSSVKVWNCAEYRDGIWRLPANPSMECGMDNREYVVLLLLSVIMFCVYFFGSSYLFFSIAESSNARKATADNYVTHARCDPTTCTCSLHYCAVGSFISFLFLFPL